MSELCQTCSQLFFFLLSLLSLSIALFFPSYFFFHLFYFSLLSLSFSFFFTHHLLFLFFLFFSIHVVGFCSFLFPGFQIPPEKQSTAVPIIYDGQEYVLRHGSVVIAAITSCTNTRLPSVKHRLMLSMRINEKTYFCSFSVKQPLGDARSRFGGAKSGRERTHSPGIRQDQPVTGFGGRDLLPQRKRRYALLGKARVSTLVL